MKHANRPDVRSLPLADPTRPAEVRTRSSGSARSGPAGSAIWFRSPVAWRFVLVWFVPLLAAGNLIWETLHLPLYTLWQEGTPQTRAFAVVHCTVGDVMIGTAALFISVMLFGRHGWPYLGHGLVLGATIVSGVVYTVFSEWMNTHITMGWQYDVSMLRVPPLGTGITPLLQWIIVPLVAYSLARALGPARRTHRRGES